MCRYRREEVSMSCKSMLVALAVLTSLIMPVTSGAQTGDAGVSGIPRGPGNAGGLNNAGNDPSGIGNAGRITAPLPPSMAVPVVPSASPLSTSRLSPRVAPVSRVKRDAVVSRRETRRYAAQNKSWARNKVRDRKVDRTLSICRGC